MTVIYTYKAVLSRLSVILCLLLGACHYQLDLPHQEKKIIAKSENKDPLYDVFSLNNRNAWVIGYYGSIHYTEDGGASEDGLDIDTTPQVVVEDPTKPFHQQTH